MFVMSQLAFLWGLPHFYINHIEMLMREWQSLCERFERRFFPFRREPWFLRKRNIVWLYFPFREDLIALALLRLLEYEKVILEADGAIGLAALLGGYLPELKGKRYGKMKKEIIWKPIWCCSLLIHAKQLEIKCMAFFINASKRKVESNVNLSDNRNRNNAHEISLSLQKNNK